ncbi:hypothetical protein FA95DRAFT_1551702 [Auriscalpium vulgare]|uniref:Uncharacterized protein n=1 Tax=Auriscalpium vulgare TaxID=40419 RepID=A0ACB8SC81_9AGAM|nr:hypothetical protein FA95DRAFT_1551702 [Auriscalpium vulgare]
MKRPTLVQYPDSDDDDDNDDNGDAKPVTPPPVKKRKLPALSSHLTVPVPVDNPSKHQGRIRSSPHVEGQWAAHVYVPVVLHDHAQYLLRRLIRDVYVRAKELVPSLQPLGAPTSGSGEDSSKRGDAADLRELHISLTRPFFLRVHQREEMKHAVKTLARKHSPFITSLVTFSELTNDERTRTFLCMEVGAGHSELRALVDGLSPSLHKFRQKDYYEQPRFHASFAWALLDTPSSLSSETLSDPKVDLTTESPPAATTASSLEFPTIPAFPSDLISTLNAEFSQKLITKAGIFAADEVHIRIGQDVSGWTLGR